MAFFGYNSIAECSVVNSVIKPTYMLTYESASELLHLNLEEEGELRILSEAANLRLNWRRQQVCFSFFLTQAHYFVFQGLQDLIKVFHLILTILGHVMCCSLQLCS